MDVDLNADVGEGFADDVRLLDAVTSANVACGGHAGSPETMRILCAAAAARGVAVGAHTSYRDREGFGRRAVDVAVDVLRADLEEQVEQLVEVAADEGVPVTFLKPHGALYARAIDDREVAAAVVATARERGLAVLAWPGSELYEQALAAELPAVAEGFADRGYAAGRLLPRDQPGALLGAEEAAAQAVALVRAGEVHSICVHGDTPGAAEVAAHVRVALVDAGFHLQPFA